MSGRRALRIVRRALCYPFVAPLYELFFSMRPQFRAYVLELDPPAPLWEQSDE